MKKHYFLISLTLYTANISRYIFLQTLCLLYVEQNRFSDNNKNLFSTKINVRFLLYVYIYVEKNGNGCYYIGVKRPRRLWPRNIDMICRSNIYTYICYAYMRRVYTDRENESEVFRNQRAKRCQETAAAAACKSLFLSDTEMFITYGRPLLLNRARVSITSVALKLMLCPADHKRCAQHP